MPYSFTPPPPAPTLHAPALISLIARLDAAGYYGSRAAHVLPYIHPSPTPQQIPTILRKLRLTHRNSP